MAQIRRYIHFQNIDVRYSGLIRIFVRISRHQNVSVLDFIGAKDDEGGEL